MYKLWYIDKTYIYIVHTYTHVHDIIHTRAYTCVHVHTYTHTHVYIYLIHISDHDNTHEKAYQVNRDSIDKNIKIFLTYKDKISEKLEV